MLTTILIVILVLFLLGGVSGPVVGVGPAYGYGFGHTGVGVIVVLLVVLLLLGRF